MSKRRIGGPSTCLLGVLCLLGTGCVDAFGGSAIDMDFQPAVNAPALAGVTPPGPGTPPFGTFFSLYAVQYVYETDADGNVVTDVDGEPVIDGAFTHKAFDFEIARLVELDSPCFIDTDSDPYPGIHSSKELDRLKEDYGINDPIADTDKPLQHRIEVLTAEVRHDVQIDLQNTVKAIVTFSEVLPPGQHPDFQMGTTCVVDGASESLIPPIDCTDDESNRVRLTLCRAFWDANPTFYQGNDKVFSIPRNGAWYGGVNGTNPKNGAPFLGGAIFFSPAALHAVELDALLLNWQFKDIDGDGEPDYPAGTPDAEKSSIGFHYMAGEPTKKTRGVINVEMRNRTILTVEADAAIFPGLADDDVNF